MELLLVSSFEDEILMGPLNGARIERQTAVAVQVFAVLKFETGILCFVMNGRADYQHWNTSLQNPVNNRPQMFFFFSLFFFCYVLCVCFVNHDRFAKRSNNPFSFFNFLQTSASLKHYTTQVMRCELCH